jgi:hypothetical protein
VFAAVVVGFAGGAMITTSSKVDPPNRLERVTAGTSAAQVPATETKPAVPITPAAAAAAAPPPAAPAVEARNDAAQASPPPDRVVSLTPTPQPAETPKPVVAPQQSPAAASDDAASKSDTVQKARESEARKEAAVKRAERRAEWRERRKRQDLESAANAVRQMRRDDGPVEVIQRDDTPRSGFFGDDN